MKLIFCLQAYFPHGGLQKKMLRMARASAARGCQAHIVTGRWQGPQPADLRITVLPIRAWSNYQWVKKFVQQAQAFIAEQKADCVIGFNRMPGLDVYYAADPCYHARFEALPWYKKINPRCRYYLALEKSLFQADQALQVLTLTQAAAQQFAQAYPHTKAQLHVLPPAVDPQKFSVHAYQAHEQDQLKQHYGLKATDTLLMMVAADFKNKGLDRVINALASLPEAVQRRIHCWIIGDDKPDAYQALAKSQQLQASLKFLGGRDDVPDLLKTADVLLHPAYKEVGGNVLLEALVSALPVITTANCGYARYIQQAKSGIVLPSPFEQTQFNQALQGLLMQTDTLQLRQSALNFCQENDLFNGIDAAVDMISKAHT